MFLSSYTVLKRARLFLSFCFFLGCYVILSNVEERRLINVAELNSLRGRLERISRRVDNLSAQTVDAWASIRDNLSAHKNNPAAADLPQSDDLKQSFDNLEMIRQVRQRNKAQQIISRLPTIEVIRWKNFTKPIASNKTVMVIQVHNRPEHLRNLIESLRLTRHIEDCLLIFSHDVLSDELDEIVRTIDFAPAMQIFLPHSMQIYPLVFPGTDPNDCPRNMKKEEAVRINCNNADHPDKYGHYREAKFAQIKHHWTWKLAFLFESVSLLRNYSGWVLFLEEDHYVAPDIVHVIRLAVKQLAEFCADCQVITVGNYNKVWDANSLQWMETTYWGSSQFNMGMVFQRSLFEKLKKCANDFCTFDDYNWDWSLHWASQKCIQPKLGFQVLYTATTRVFHMGECGLHHKGKNCDPKALVQVVDKRLRDAADKLFPDVLHHRAGKRRRLVPKPSGGWGDVRDHQLCLKLLS